ncbi:MAG: rod shape-determining protein MreC [Actinomycetota bacterium]|nr:rod shape-determining protein MreC [Actinomycetota bacterium]
MPRNRTARLAVLASVAQRSASAPYSSRAASSLRRRALVAALVLVSLALITVYFRESDDGWLHGTQGVAATVLRPFQIGAERVAGPFRDVYGYFSDLVHAKSEADRLRAENSRLRQRSIEYGVAIQENARLRRIARYQAKPPFPRGYRLLAAEVIAQAPGPYERQITVAAGANGGVEKNDAVVDPDGQLVGTVTLVGRDVARVTLLTDESSAVSARDVNTGARGIVRHASGGGSALFLDMVKKKEKVVELDVVGTAGWRSGRLTSLYPKGIPIGWVSSVDQLDTDLYKRVQVTPYADFSALESVMVVTDPKRRAG